VSTGLAFSQEYLDSSFRTPAEVLSELKIPVLASVPLYGRNGNGDHGVNGNGHATEIASVPATSEPSVGRESDNVDYR
jgi:hypothetical protein